jgi:trehalose-6-phosphate synthase
MLCSDLIGFQTDVYAEHFKQSCKLLLNEDYSRQGFSIDGRFSVVDTFSIGIDLDRFTGILRTPAFRRHAEQLRKKYGSRKVIVGVDRLDYIKGIPHKLKIVEKFLSRDPEWCVRHPPAPAAVLNLSCFRCRAKKAVFVQIAVPSRGNVVEYQELKSKTHELVSSVNGRFGSVSGSLPIEYYDQSVPIEQMVALFSLADACLVTSLRYVYRAEPMRCFRSHGVSCQGWDEPRFSGVHRQSAAEERSWSSDPQRICRFCRSTER